MTVRTATGLLVLLLGLCHKVWALSPLYDSAGQPVAYLAENQVIYLWSGEPIAYLEPAYSNSPSVFSFAGTHLAWFVEGCLRDHQGRILGTDRAPQPLVTRAVEPGSAWQPLPQKLTPERVPFRPRDLPLWAPKPLGQILVEARSC